jgi:hypothetical protein
VSFVSYSFASSLMADTRMKTSSEVLPGTIKTKPRIVCFSHKHSLPGFHTFSVS